MLQKNRRKLPLTPKNLSYTPEESIALTQTLTSDDMD